MESATPLLTAEKPTKTHPLWLRLTHWLTALGVIILVLSGWQIYDASPIWHFRIPPQIALGGWLGGALLWHFAAMWLLLVNGTVYLIMNIVTGRLARKFFPVRPREVWRDFIAALTFRLHHDDLTHYNAVQKLAYLLAIVDLIVLVCSGLVLWKSVQFPLLRTLLGGYDTARIVHFCAMAVIAGFIVVHVTLVALVPRTLLGMTRGRF